MILYFNPETKLKKFIDDKRKIIAVDIDGNLKSCKQELEPNDKRIGYYAKRRISDSIWEAFWLENGQFYYIFKNEHNKIEFKELIQPKHFIEILNHIKARDKTYIRTLGYEWIQFYQQSWIKANIANFDECLKLSQNIIFTLHRLKK